MSNNQQLFTAMAAAIITASPGPHFPYPIRSKEPRPNAMGYIQKPRRGSDPDKTKGTMKQRLKRRNKRKNSR